MEKSVGSSALRPERSFGSSSSTRQLQLPHVRSDVADSAVRLIARQRVRKQQRHAHARSGGRVRSRADYTDDPFMDESGATDIDSIIYHDQDQDSGAISAQSDSHALRSHSEGDSECEGRAACEQNVSFAFPLPLELPPVPSSLPHPPPPSHMYHVQMPVPASYPSWVAPGGLYGGGHVLPAAAAAHNVVSGNFEKIQYNPTWAGDLGAETDDGYGEGDEPTEDLETEDVGVGNHGMHHQRAGFQTWG